MSLSSDALWRYHPRDYTPYDDLHTPYDLARVSAVHRSWSRFCEQYLHNAELLKILLGASAKDAHIEASVVPESKAKLAVEMLRTKAKKPTKGRAANLMPMGDS